MGDRCGLLGAGIIAGSVYAATAQPVYVDGGYRCRWVRNFDAWGNYVGTSKVCPLRSREPAIGAYAPPFPRADLLDPPGSLRAGLHFFPGSEAGEGGV